MNIDIITIGNSQGIRLPKAILAQFGFDTQVRLTIDKDRMILSKPLPSNLKSPRKNWDKRISSALNVSGKRTERLPYFANDWDESEWEW